MKTVKDIFDYLNTLAPVGLKMSFDNVGILVGSADAPVKKCLFALDITDEVIDEAMSICADLIVSHHPLIFHELKSVVAEDLVGRKIIKLIKNDISAVCMHTNLDIAQDGVNDALMSALGGCVSGFLELCGTDADGAPVGCGRIGELSESIDPQSFSSSWAKNTEICNHCRRTCKGPCNRASCLLSGHNFFRFRGRIQTALYPHCNRTILRDIQAPAPQRKTPFCHVRALKRQLRDFLPHCPP